MEIAHPEIRKTASSNEPEELIASRSCRWGDGVHLLLVEKRRLPEPTDEHDKTLNLGEASAEFKLYRENAGSKISNEKNSFWSESWSFLSKVSPVPKWYGDIYCDAASANVYVILARSWADGVTLRLYKTNLDETDHPSESSGADSTIRHDKLTEYAKKLPPFECSIRGVSLMRDHDSFLIYLERSQPCTGLMLRFDQPTSKWAELDFPK